MEDSDYIRNMILSLQVTELEEYEEARMIEKMTVTQETKEINEALDLKELDLKESDRAEGDKSVGQFSPSTDPIRSSEAPLCSC